MSPAIFLFILYIEHWSYNYLCLHSFDIYTFKREAAVKFLLNLFVSALELDANKGEHYSELLTSVCSYTSFPLKENYESCVFLLDLCSHVKDYETQTGRSVLPALQPIYQSAPAVWRIKLSERKSSILLELLKLQRKKKPVELIDWTDEESEVKGFLQCLPYISQLRSVSHGENTTLGLIYFISIFSALSYDFWQQKKSEYKK